MHCKHKSISLGALEPTCLEWRSDGELTDQERKLIFAGLGLDGQEECRNPAGGLPTHPIATTTFNTTTNPHACSVNP